MPTATLSVSRRLRAHTVGRVVIVLEELWQEADDTKTLSAYPGKGWGACNGSLTQGTFCNDHTCDFKHMPRCHGEHIHCHVASKRMNSGRTPPSQTAVLFGRCTVHRRCQVMPPL